MGQAEEEQAEDLMAALLQARPSAPGEAADLSRLRALAATTAAWDRTTLFHVTASAIVVHPPTRRVLLRWHERQGAWIQVGGHADAGEHDPLVVARREAAEETGLDDLTPWPDADRPGILHAVIVPVPPNAREPAHEHGDIRYALATSRPERARPEGERAPLRWLTLDEAEELTTEPNVRETLQRVRRLLTDRDGEG